jgi:tRNA threonylcarbamoyladenosine biosynthesis protein TsaB
VRVLALDAATEACSVALLNGDELTHRMMHGGRCEASQILDMVDALLAEAGLTLAALDGIAASVGPGAFTGVRIGVAVAQGLAFGSGLPVAAVTTLEALAMPLFRAGATRALACLDARMGEVYWGCFAADPTEGLLAAGAARVGPPESVALPTDGSYQGVGRGFAAYPLLARLPGLTVAAEASDALPSAREFARLGALRLGLGDGLDPGELCPVYLRDKVALTSAERALK